uniref:Uncharacterized protein n=1 Tax=viral metagenome TaxID=1070528 RepID=A0A6C0DDN4_9ZZZZ
MQYTLIPKWAIESSKLLFSAGYMYYNLNMLVKYNSQQNNRRILQ